MTSTRRVLMADRDLALSSRNIPMFHLITRLIAELPFDGVPLPDDFVAPTDAERQQYSEWKLTTLESLA